MSGHTYLGPIDLTNRPRNVSLINRSRAKPWVTQAVTLGTVQKVDCDTWYSIVHDSCRLKRMASISGVCSHRLIQFNGVSLNVHIRFFILLLTHAVFQV